MDFFEVVKNRRSIRKFTSQAVPEAFVNKALEAAILAPNSSNTQTWDFYWIKSADKKTQLINFCLNQSAARTAAELIVIVADPKKWKRSQAPLIDWVTAAKAPQSVIMYYQKIIPLTYRWGFFNSLAPIKWLATTAVGLFRPIVRGPHTKADIQEVAIKSAALAAENFVLALTAQGVSTCMMEGFDEWRVKQLLQLSFSARVVMVIGIGYEGDRATWGPQFRLPMDNVVHNV